MLRSLSFVLNGTATTVGCPVNELLIDLLRDRLGLTGTKRSCDIEVCGACTVLVDGLAVSACTTLAFDVEGRSVETIEGLQSGDRLNVVQQAFVDQSAAQCGYCTPGMVLTVQSLLIERPDADEECIREYLAGTICRCTGYVSILKAARQAIDAS